LQYFVIGMELFKIGWYTARIRSHPVWVS